MTATTNEDSIQALSYCAKNPSQKLPAEQAKIIRKQQRKQNISPFGKKNITSNINLNTEENDEDDNNDPFEKVKNEVFVIFYSEILTRKVVLCVVFFHEVK